MSESGLPEFVEYPPAPWRSRGRMWSGFLSTSAPLTAPLPMLSGSRSLAMLLIRYQEGTLTYDEFVLASLVRHGRHPGMWVHRIWVDSAASLWGGREIWGVPKQLASFAWNEHGVEISDADGVLASLSLAARGRALPMPLQFGGFGRHSSKLLLSKAVVQGRIAPARIEVMKWSTRLPSLARTTARFGVTLNPMRIVVHEPQQFGSVLPSTGPTGE